MKNSGSDESLTVDVQQINAVCAEFMSNWNDRPHPRIEDRLSRFPPPWQGALLRALLPVEVNLRRQLGEKFSRKEYESRFPGFVTIVAETEFPSSSGSRSRAQRAQTGTELDKTKGKSGVVPDRSDVAPENALAWEVTEGKTFRPHLAPVHERFEILRLIAQGGMGVVYEALDRESGIHVAIKTLHERFTESADRLKREFRTLCDLRHPNLVALHELFASENVCFFTMEFVDGRPFQQAVRGECPAASGAVADDASAVAIPGVADAGWSVDALQRFIDAAGQVVEGVWALHDAGFVHRDLKPSNVLVTASGRVVVLDLGLALKLQAGDAATTGPAPFGGTRAYMAPEQAEGDQRLTPAADWYSFGVMLYQTLTGRLPFAVKSGAISSVAPQPPPAPLDRFPAGVPRELVALCLSMLECEPHRRPNAEQIAGILSDLRTTPKRLAPRTLPSPRTASFVGREVELSRLREQLRTAPGDRLQIVVVRGESGQGKTRLVDEFLRSSTSPREQLVLAGRCFERENIPFKAWDTVIDSLVSVISDLRLPVRGWLGPDEQRALASMFPCFQGLFAVPADASAPCNEPSDRRSAAFAALRRLVVRLADTRRLIIAIDDVHWADLDSAALLREVFVSGGSVPALLIVTARVSEANATPFADLITSLGCDAQSPSGVEVCQINLAPLNPVDCENLVQDLLEVRQLPGVTRDTVRTLSQAAGGHPLLAFALTQVYALGRVTAAGETGGSIVRRAMDEWISELPVATRQLLAVICLATQPLSQRVALAAAAVHEDPEAAVSLLRLKGLIALSYRHPETLLMPFHDVVREQVVGGLAGTMRQSVHGRLASVLEAESNSAPEVLAHHFAEAGEPQQAADYFLTAGSRASEGLAFELAAKMYGQAVALGQHTSEWECSVRERQADALAAAGCSSDAGELYQRAAEQAQVPVDQQRLLRRAAYQYCVSGRIEDGSRLLNQSLRNFDMRLYVSRVEVVVRLLTERGRLALRGGLRFKHRGPAELDPKLIERVDVTWETSIALTMIDTLQGALFQSTNLRLALAAGDPARIARACLWQSTHVATRGQSARPAVGRLLACADELRQQGSSEYLDALSELARGITAYFLGEWRKSTQGCESAADAFRNRCRYVSWEVNTAQAFWLWSLLFRGELKTLGDELPKLLEEAKRRGNRLSESSLANFGGPHVWLARDEPDKAAEIVNRAMTMWPGEVFHVQHFTCLAGLTQVDLYAGRVEEAYDRIESGWGRLRGSLFLQIEAIRIFMRHLRGRCGLALAAKTGDRSDLIRGVAREARKLERETAPWAQAMALSLRSGLARLEGRPEIAAAALSRAAEGFEQAEMRLFEMCARRARGTLVGGTEGRRDVEIAERWICTQEIADIDAMTALHCPGLRSS